MGSLIKVVATTNRLCVISSRALAATHQRCFFSTINDSRLAHVGLKNNLRRVRNCTANTVSNFIYTNIMNRFGLFNERVYSMAATRIEPSMSETDESLYYSLQLKGVISREKVTVRVRYNELGIEAVVYDEFKAAHHIYYCVIKLPEDSYYLNYNMKGIKADFSKEGGGELKLTIPKFKATDRILNEKKDEAGEFSKLRGDAFRFRIKVNAI